MSQDDLAMNLDVDHDDLMHEGDEIVHEGDEIVYEDAVDEVQQEVPTEDEYAFTTKVKKIYTCMRMPSDLWEDQKGSVDLVTMVGFSYKETMDKLMEEINDPVPKEMTIFCFHEFIYTMDNNQLFDGCDHLIKMVKKSGIHDISFCCAPFPPNEQKFWYRIGMFNAEMRIFNISREIPPLTLHKSLMKFQNEDGTGPCIVKGYMWQEYCDRVGLGSTPSYDGFVKIKKQLVLAVNMQFIKMVRKASRYWPGTIKPPPLCTNDDYLKKPIMVKFLKEKDQFNIRDSCITAPQPKKSSSTSSVQSGASATPAERALDSLPKPRPATWYGQNLSVNFQPLGERRKVSATKIDEETFEDKTVESDYNEGNSSDKPSKDKTKEELLREVRKLRADKTHALSEQKKREDYLKERINKLHDEIDKEEDENKRNEKQVDKYKKELEQADLEIEALKLVKGLKDQKISKLEADLENKTTTATLLQNQVNFLSEQYEFIKRLHDEKSGYMEMLLGKEVKKDSKKKKK